MLIPVHERQKPFYSIEYLQILETTNLLKIILVHIVTDCQHELLLKKCNKKTMFLIDEFGTGSDPELGVLWLKFSLKNSTIEKLLES
jgi:DNA mismatch repair protein MutS2